MSQVSDQYYELIGRATKYVDRAPLIKFSDITERLDYIPRFETKPGIHIGQRKLFMSELQFLNNVLVDLSTPTYVVYAGAAPGNHMGMLSTFFPNVKWILVDPHRFDIFYQAQSHLIPRYPFIQYLKSAFGADEADLSMYDDETDIAAPKSGSSDSRRTGAAAEWKGESTLMRGEVGSNRSRGGIADKHLWCRFIRQAPARIFLVEDYMTDDYAQLFSELRPYFISDIRTNMIEDAPTDTDIIWNCAQQYNWVNYIRARGYMLKFRTPYYESITLEPSDDQLETFAIARAFGIDFVADYAKELLTYLAGDVYIQCWAGKSSTEGRLVSLIPANDGPEPHPGAGPYVDQSGTHPAPLPDAARYPRLALADYEPREYEDRFFYFNCIERGFVHHWNRFANRALGFDNCNDCALEAQIWSEYTARFADIDVLAAVRQLSATVQRGLLMRGHGYFFAPDAEYVRRRLNSKLVNRRRLRFEAATVTPRSVVPDERHYTMQQILDNSMRRMSLRNASTYRELWWRAVGQRAVKPPVHITDVPDSVLVERGATLFKGGILSFAERLEMLAIIQFIVDHAADLGDGGGGGKRGSGSKRGGGAGAHYLVITAITFAGSAIEYLTEWFPSLIIMQFGSDNREARHFNGSLPSHGFTAYRTEFDEVLERWPGVFVSESTLLVADRRPPGALPDEKFIIDIAQAYLHIRAVKPAAWLTKIRMFNASHSTFTERAAPGGFTTAIGLARPPLRLDQLRANPHIAAAADAGYDLIRDWGFRVAAPAEVDASSGDDTDLAAAPPNSSRMMQRRLRGEIYVNAHGWYGSTQCTMHGTGAELADYPLAEDIGRISYWNYLQRGFVHHHNPAAMPDIGFDNCGDCAVEAAIWEKYNAAADAASNPLTLNPRPVQEHVRRLIDITKANLLTGSHGMLTRPLDEQLLNAMFKREYLDRKNMRNMRVGDSTHRAGGGAGICGGDAFGSHVDDVGEPYIDDVFGGDGIDDEVFGSGEGSDTITRAMIESVAADARRWLTSEEFAEFEQLAATYGIVAN